MRLGCGSGWRAWRPNIGARRAGGNMPPSASISSLKNCVLTMGCWRPFFSTWRRADREARGYALDATAAYLQATLSVPATALTAVVAPYYEHRLLEWRIGFSRLDDEQVLHGVVWPLLGAEDETADTAGEIEAILRQAGVGRIVILDQQHLAPERVQRVDFAVNGSDFDIVK